MNKFSSMLLVTLSLCLPCSQIFGSAFNSEQYGNSQYGPAAAAGLHRHYSFLILSALDPIYTAYMTQGLGTPTIDDEAFHAAMKQAMEKPVTTEDDIFYALWAGFPAFDEDQINQVWAYYKQPYIADTLKMINAIKEPFITAPAPYRYGAPAPAVAPPSATYYPPAPAYIPPAGLPLYSPASGYGGYNPMYATAPPAPAAVYGGMPAYYPSTSSLLTPQQVSSVLALLNRDFVQAAATLPRGSIIRINWNKLSPKISQILVNTSLSDSDKYDAIKKEFFNIETTDPKTGKHTPATLETKVWDAIKGNIVPHIQRLPQLPVDVALSQIEGVFLSSGGTTTSWQFFRDDKRKKQQPSGKLKVRLGLKSILNNPKLDSNAKLALAKNVYKIAIGGVDETGPKWVTWNTIEPTLRAVVQQV